MTQQTQPVTPAPEPPKKKRRGLLYGFIGATVFLVIIVAASSNGDKDSSEPAKDTGSHSAPKEKAQAEKTDLVADFKAYAAKNNIPSGTAAAVKHVTKIQGADGNNDILDSADIYTDYAGDLMSGDAASGKLIASSFADWQKSRGKASKNGLVTVYNKDGDMLNNGKY